MTAVLVTCVLLLAADPPPKAKPKPVAMVLVVEGKATLTRNGKSRPLREVDLLQKDDVLEAAEKAVVRVVILSDGHEELLKPGKQAKLEAAGCTPAEAVTKEAATLSKSQQSNLRDITGSEAGVGVPRGRGPSADAQDLVVFPPAGTTVLSLKPVLSWDAVDKAKSYDVELFDGDGRKRLWQETTDKPRLEYPAKQKPLEPGVVYQWRVTAHLEDGKDKAFEKTDFLTLTKTEMNELEALSQQTKSIRPSDWLLAALTYEAHGVYAEALEQYERLAQAHPKAANYHKALATYYDQAGRKEKAAAEQKKAKELEAADEK